VKVGLLRGSGVDQDMIDHAFQAMRARHVEAVELQRDAPAEKTAVLLEDTGLILTLGGDGTFLAGARLAVERGIPILGVNHGHLGFLTEIEADEMDDGLGRYLDGSYRIEERTMLQVTLLRNGRSMLREIGLNEVVVDRLRPRERRSDPRADAGGPGARSDEPVRAHRSSHRVRTWPGHQPLRHTRAG
jgi:NAD kinase